MAAEYAGEGCGSLPVETAGEMLRSLQFAIGAALKGYAASEQAAIALKERPLNELYDEGLCRVRQKLRTVRLLPAEDPEPIVSDPERILAFHHRRRGQRILSAVPAGVRRP